jgi:hypothetical protein
MGIITEAFNTQATGTLELLLQQETSLLRNHVKVQMMQGSDSVYPSLQAEVQHE